MLRTTLAALPLQDTGTRCCALEGSSFPSGAAQPLPIAFRFQPTAINTHPLIFKCSRHGGTQAASTFHLFLRSPAPGTLCLRSATLPLVPLLCAISYPLAASAASLVTAAESTALGIQQHRVVTPPSHQGLLGYQLAPDLRSGAGTGGRAWQEQPARGRGGRAMLLPTSLVPTGRL